MEEEIEQKRGIIGRVAKIAYKTGKILVERKVFYFLGGVIVGFLLPVETSLACTLAVKGEVSTEKNIMKFFPYVKTFSSRSAWIKYFKDGKSSPEYFFYRNKVSTTFSKLSPLVPLVYFSLGAASGFLYSENFSDTKNFSCAENFSCVNDFAYAKIQKKLLYCVQDNELFTKQVDVIVGNLMKKMYK